MNAIIDLPAGVAWSNMRGGPGTGYADLGDLEQDTKITYSTVNNNYVRVLSAELNGSPVLTSAGKRMDEVEVWTYKPNVRDVADPPPPSGTDSVWVKGVVVDKDENGVETARYETDLVEAKKVS